ncbi:class I SAM-dependent methyltransferase [candidate division KSB1 bacterium]|nr:class I SAM-dependent methyltransferase [candidate division KSB1 bacterium]
MKTEISQKYKQQSYFDSKGISEFEITRPHGAGRLYEFLIHFKLKSTAALIGNSLQGKKLLNICCGSGMEAEYFANRGAKVVGLDISSIALQGALQRAERFDFTLKTVTGDAENLPFSDQSFDFVFVHDGLHHLNEPDKAIREMARVARQGIFFTEPANAFITRIAVKLGLAGDFEEAGNFVYRFHPRQLRRLFNSIGLAQPKFKRYGMWYPHQPTKWFRWFDNALLFTLFKAFFHTVNFLVGRWGNKIAVCAWRKEQSA